MFENDDAARQALRTLTDDPAPPVTTTVDQVLRRGKRRVFVQRAVAIAGVVAVVAAIGAATVLLRSAEEEPSGGGVQVAATTAAKPTGPMPGWEWIPIDEEACEKNGVSHVPGTPPPTILPQAVVQSAFTGAVESATGVEATTVESDWTEYAQKAGGPRGYLAVEVPMDNG
ncbi:MAG: hypothetical protein M3422_25635, partial [Actinomycetota bacterium]|nr:hypothetical protein [Actinomycetota bacterium]